MFDFNPQSPYHRRMWHYESDRPLSVAQLVALGSLDTPTAALLWLLLEHHASLIVSGPTDPTPGIGKSTTINALLGFLPAGSSLVYTLGMFEDFTFRQRSNPATTWVLANEVSDHLRIYMWGNVARRLLRLPGEGYAVATSCHADTLDDVLALLLGDLRLRVEDVRRLGIIINIGLVGRVWPPRRRVLSAYFVVPSSDAPAVGPPAASVTRTDGLRLLPLARWDAAGDSFAGPTDDVRDALASIVGMAPQAFRAALDRRSRCVAALAQGHGVGAAAMRAAVIELTAREAETETGDADTGAPGLDDSAPSNGS